jgi:hypothetical protein
MAANHARRRLRRKRAMAQHVHLNEHATTAPAHLTSRRTTRAKSRMISRMPLACVTRIHSAEPFTTPALSPTLHRRGVVRSGGLAASAAGNHLLPGAMLHAGGGQRGLECVNTMMTVMY